jgi:PAS domain S-box-containing protein
MSNPIALRYSIAIFGAMLIVVLSHQMPHGYIFLIFFPLLIFLAHGSRLPRMPIDLAAFASIAILARLLMPAVRPQGGLSLHEVLSALIATWLAAIIMRRLGTDEAKPASLPASGYNLLKNIFSQAAEGVLVVDGKGEIVLINPAAERQLGYGPDELIGMPVEQVIPRWVVERNEEYNYRLEDPMHAKPIGEYHKMYGFRKDGRSFEAETSLTTFSTTEGLFVVAFISDFKTNDNLY